MEDMFGPGVEVGVIEGEAPFLGGGVFEDGFYFAGLQSECFTEFAEDGILLEGAVSSEQGGVFAAVPFEDIVGHIVAFIPGEVDIEVWGGAALGVNEAFEVEV